MGAQVLGIGNQPYPQHNISEAVKAAVAAASQTVSHMDWFEVVEPRGYD
jgi:flavin-binding protein dodecin